MAKRKLQEYANYAGQAAAVEQLVRWFKGFDGNVALLAFRALDNMGAALLLEHLLRVFVNPRKQVPRCAPRRNLVYYEATNKDLEVILSRGKSAVEDAKQILKKRGCCTWERRPSSVYAAGRVTHFSVDLPATVGLLKEGHVRAVGDFGRACFQEGRVHHDMEVIKHLNRLMDLGVVPSDLRGELGEGAIAYIAGQSKGFEKREGRIRSGDYTRDEAGRKLAKLRRDVEAKRLRMRELLLKASWLMGTEPKPEDQGTIVTSLMSRFRPSSLAPDEGHGSGSSVESVAADGVPIPVQNNPEGTAAPQAAPSPAILGRAEFRAAGLSNGGMGATSGTSPQRDRSNGPPGRAGVGGAEHRRQAGGDLEGEGPTRPVSFPIEQGDATDDKPGKAPASGHERYGYPNAGTARAPAGTPPTDSGDGLSGNQSAEGLNQHGALSSAIRPVEAELVDKWARHVAQVGQLSRAQYIARRKGHTDYKNEQDAVRRAIVKGLFRLWRALFKEEPTSYQRREIRRILRRAKKASRGHNEQATGALRGVMTYAKVTAGGHMVRLAPPCRQALTPADIVGVAPAASWRGQLQHAIDVLVPVEDGEVRRSAFVEVCKGLFLPMHEQDAFVLVGILGRAAKKAAPVDYITHMEAAAEHAWSFSDFVRRVHVLVADEVGTVKAENLDRKLYRLTEGYAESVSTPAGRIVAHVRRELLELYPDLEEDAEGEDD